MVTFWRIFFAHEIWRAIIEIRLFFQIVLGEHLIGAYGAGPFENSGTFNIFFWPLSYQVHLILYEKKNYIQPTNYTLRFSLDLLHYYECSKCDVAGSWYNGGLKAN